MMRFALAIWLIILTVLLLLLSMWPTAAQNIQPPLGQGCRPKQDAEDRLRIQRAMERLPVNYSELVLLRFAEQLAFAEIAEMQGKTLDAVKSLFRRALAALKTEMDRE